MSELNELQESLKAKDAHIKALRETMVATMEDLKTACALKDARIKELWDENYKLKEENEKLKEQLAEAEELVDYLSRQIN